jgi:hypothetical protein
MIEGKEKEYRESQYIYTDKLGHEIFGRSYLNTELFSLDINRHGLKLNINPSTLMHPYELYGIDALSEIEEKVLTALDKNGIEIDVSSSSITRLDLTKQAETRQPCSNYGSLFQYLKMPRYKDTQNFESGYTWGHSSSAKQIVFYDKREELFLKKQIELSSTLTRCEARWKKKAGSQVGISSYGQLKGAPQESIEYIFNKQIDTLLRHPSGTQLSIDFPKEVEYIKALRIESPKGYINKWLSHQGAIAVMETLGTRGNLVSLLKESGMSSKKAQVKAKQIEQIAIKESTRKNGSYISIDEHLNELRNCFL